jgi:hypothetical protein
VRQICIDQCPRSESILAGKEFPPNERDSSMAETALYQSSYDMASLSLLSQTLLAFTFELLELELFMRPFEKLMRVAI